MRQKRPNTWYIWKRRGLKDIKYDVPVSDSCGKRIIQQVILLGVVHILKLYNFQSEFRTVEHTLVWISVLVILYFT